MKAKVFRGLRWVLAFLALIWLVWQLTIVVRLWWWSSHNPQESAFMALRAAERQAQHKTPLEPHPWVSYRQIPDSLKRAVIAAEDAKFAVHRGFDWDGIDQALKRDIRRGRFVAGGSTITQQLAKNLFLSERRSIFRKLEEAIITVMIETMWSKPRILEVYLNSIEWGDGVFGCEAASRRYFHRSSAELSGDQAAYLAAMIPNPRYYDHHRSHPKLVAKQFTVEARMPNVAIPR